MINAGADAEKFDVIEEARGVFDKEIKALQLTRDAVGHDFEVILDLILNANFACELH